MTEMVEKVARAMVAAYDKHRPGQYASDLNVTQADLDAARAAIEALRPKLPTDDEIMAYGMQGAFVPQAYRDRAAIIRWIDAALPPVEG